MNPLTWLLGNTLFLVGLLLWKSTITPVLAFFGLIGLGMLAGTPLPSQLRRLAPYLGLGLLWMLTSAIFYGPPPGQPLTLWVKIGPFPLYRQAVEWGVLRAFRLLDMIAFGSLILAQVRADDLALSLAQNAKLPYRYAFTLQAAYRMIPSLAEEAEQIRRAQIVRGVAMRRGLWGEALKLAKMAGPLLAGALRRADRLALAMESRGFGAYPDRTYRREMGFSVWDGVGIAVLCALLVALTLCDRLR